MKMISEGEQTINKFNEQMDCLDIQAVEGLMSEIHDAHSFGYEYVDVAKLERALPALAALFGATTLLNAEDALEYLATKAVTNNPTVENLQKENKVLVAKVEKADAAEEKFDEKIAELEQRPAGPEVVMNIYTDPQRWHVIDVLKEASEALTKVPNQRSLAQKAIHATQLLDNSQSITVVVVEENNL